MQIGSGVNQFAFKLLILVQSLLSNMTLGCQYKLLKKKSLHFKTGRVVFLM